MITTLGMSGGEDVEETPEVPQKESLMGQKARVTRGARAGEIVEIVAEKDGMTTAVWTGPLGDPHRFAAPSNMFMPVATRRRAKRVRKKKAK